MRSQEVNLSPHYVRQKQINDIMTHTPQVEEGSRNSKNPHYLNYHSSIRYLRWHKKEDQVYHTEKGERFHQDVSSELSADTVDNWCRFLILLVESWRIVIISGTVHWFWLKTSFHPLLWTSSGLTGSWKLSTYIGLGSLRSVKSVKTRGNGSLRSVESVKPNGNWKPKKFKMCKT